MLSRPSLARASRTLAFRSTRPFSASVAAREHFLDANAEVFDAQVAGDRVTLVDFYADWCGPCRMLTPILKTVVPTSSPDVNLLTVNTDNEQELAGRYKIAALPTVLAFRNGKVVDKFVGVKNQAGVLAFLAEVKAKK
ncbi:hypothetical protein RQP46_001952 [Phenoliferia psychrophenolica]